MHLMAGYAKRMEQGQRFLRIKEVRQRTGLGTTTIYKRVNEGTFPPNVSLGPRMAAWVESEVDAWISSQATTDREPWTPPLPPRQKVGEKKLPPLVPNEKGAEAAAKIAGVVGLKVPEGEPPPPDIEIALRFPDWPEMMRQRTAAAYLDLSESVHTRGVSRDLASPGDARRPAILEPAGTGRVYREAPRPDARAMKSASASLDGRARFHPVLGQCSRW